MGGQIYNLRVGKDFLRHEKYKPYLKIYMYLITLVVNISVHPRHPKMKRQTLKLGKDIFQPKNQEELFSYKNSKQQNALNQ